MLDQGVLKHHAINIPSGNVTPNLTGRKYGCYNVDTSFWNKTLYTDPPYTTQRPQSSLSYSEALSRRKLPFKVSVKGADVNPSGNVDTLSEVIDVLQRTLNTVKDGTHDSWPQLYRKRFSCPEDRVSDRHTS